MNIGFAWGAVASVAYKEFLHVWRDRRILALILVLPPFFTLLFGHAFEATELAGVPAAIIDRDKTEQSAKLVEVLGKKKTFAWKATQDTGFDIGDRVFGERISVPGTTDSGFSNIKVPDASGLHVGQFVTGAGIPGGTTILAITDTTVTLSSKATASGSTSLTFTGAPDLLKLGISAALVIPKGWTSTLEAGSPIPMQLYLDGTDATSADELEGRLRQSLGDFQATEDVQELTVKPLLEELPPEVFDAMKKITPESRAKLKVEFQKLVKPWQTDTRILYNPGLRFIDFVTPGIIGLILQLLTVTLMACTIAREREAGTLAQLIVTPLRRLEIVVGKVIPYLGISMLLIVVTIAVAYFHFDVHFRQPATLGLLCLLFLLCSLGSGLLISAFCNTQTQAIQFAVFYLLPVFPLSGAFAPIQRLPESVRVISNMFPLTHFCEAFRMTNLRNADLSFIAGDLAFLAIGAIVTCGGAAWILSRTDA